MDRQEFRPTVYPANQIITANRTVALQSFIGTDNHQATAEMRPSPAHNIGRHMYDLAYGLHETDKWLAGHKRFNRLKITAQPFIGDEPLGGHIHCSFFVDEPLTKLALSLNRMYKNDRLTTFDPTQIVPNVTNEQAAQLNEYLKSIYEGGVFTHDKFAILMDHLIWPFECAIQPWWDRARRNGRYGGMNGQGDRVRQNVSYPKAASKFKDLAYLHYEYRAPSTWLVHPWLAYVYLSLAKLTMLNIPLVEAHLDKPSLPKATNSPMNDEFRKVFMARLKVFRDKAKFTRDIRDLEQVVDACFNARVTWFEALGKAVDIDAWRRLL